MSTRFKEVAEQFLQLEEELGLHSLRIDGYPAWEGIRVTTFHDLLHRLGITGQMHPDAANAVRKGWLRRKSDRLSFLRQDFWQAPHADAVFICHGRRKQMPDGQWKDIYSDDFSALLSGLSVSLESSFPGGHRRPTTTQRLYYLDNLEWLVSIRRRLKKYNLQSKDRLLLHEIQQHFDRIFSIQTCIASKAEMHLASRFYKKPLLRWLLRRIHPNVLYICVAYGQEVLIEVCKELGIPVCELQHGTIGKYHMGYYFPGTPKPFSVNPDCLLTFGDYWSGLPAILPGTEKISVGFPYLEEVAARLPEVEQKNQILFISQGAVGGKLSELAVEYARLFAGEETVLFKLHPNERHDWRTNYAHLVDAGVRVLDGDEPSLYLLLAESPKVVGVYSTAVFEALRFGCHVYIAELPGWEHLQDLVDLGYATKVQYAADIAGLEGSKLSAADSSFFFCPDWERRFLSADQKIMEMG